jgi:hypothetical protein
MLIQQPSKIQIMTDLTAIVDKNQAFINTKIKTLG